MSTVEAGGLQGDKVSAIQKWHMVESDTSERKQHSRLSWIVINNIVKPGHNSDGEGKKIQQSPKSSGGNSDANGDNDSNNNND